MNLEKKTLRTIFLGVGGCILLYWVLHETERLTAVWNTVTGVFSPFVLGAALAFIMNVPMRAFEKMLKGIKKPGLRRVCALLLTFAAFLLVIFLVFWLLIPQLTLTIQTLIPQIVTFFKNVETFIRQFLSENPQLLEWIEANTELENFDWNTLLKNAMTILSNSVSTIANGAVFAIGTISGVIVDIVIGIVFSLYCLFRKEILARQARRLLYSFIPERICDEIVRIMRLSNSTFSNFISGQCLEACILGCLFAVAMSIFRMPYIPLVSVLIAVTALVPVVGAFIGCVFGAFFILVDSPIMAVWFVIMFLILQQIENNMIYPRVVGTSIGLPGMWVLVAVTVGGDMMGVAGMFLMIPVASVCYTLLREITDKRLAKRQIPLEKLQDHPPELTSKFREKREKKKQTRLHKNLMKKKAAEEEADNDQ